jgi:hypothetical protein
MPKRAAPTAIPATAPEGSELEGAPKVSLVEVELEAIDILDVAMAKAIEGLFVDDDADIVA